MRPSTLWAFSTAKISPVMKVWKSTIRPASTRAHFEWVPGSTNRPSPAPLAANAPRICVSSPRITSGAPRASSALTPGMIRTPPSAGEGASIVAAAISAAPAGQGAYGASIQPWRAPTMPGGDDGDIGAQPTPFGQKARDIGLVLARVQRERPRRRGNFGERAPLGVSER